MSYTDPDAVIFGGPIAWRLCERFNVIHRYVHVETIDIDAGTFTNTATVTGTPPTGSNVTLSPAIQSRLRQGHGFLGEIGYCKYGQ